MLSRVLSLALPLALAVGVAPGAAQEASPAASPFANAGLDLAAMTLTPGGLATVGLEGYGLSYAATRGLEAEVAAVADFRAVPEEEVAERLLGAGLEGVYLAYLDAPAPAASATPAAGATPEVEAGAAPVRQVYSSVYDFADEAGAAAAFAYLEEEGDEGGQDLPGTIAFGDESELTRAVGPDPTTGLPSVTLDLGFRIGDVTATVGVIDFGGQEPTVEELEALAARMETRIIAARADEAPGLSRLALRLEDGLVSAAEDRYLLLGGEPVVRAGESAEARERRVRGYGAAVDGFSAYQAFPAGGEGNGDDLYVQTDLLRFADGPAAAAFLAGEPRRLAGVATISEVVARPAPAGVGDEAAAVGFRSTRANGEPAAVERVYVRVGETVASVYLVGLEVPAGVVEGLAAAQVGCLEAGGCGPVAVPPGIAGLAEAPAASPLATPTA